MVILGDKLKEELIDHVMDEDVLPTKFGGKKDCGKIFDNLNAPAKSSWW